MSTKPSNSPASAPAEGEPVNTTSILSDLKGTPGESSVMPDLSAGASAKQSKLKVHSQTLVIALVLAASGASLYTMRKQGMGAGVNFNPPKIEYTPVDDVKRTASDAQQRRILGDLERSQNQAPLSVDKIPKNPFQLEAGGSVAQGTADPNAALNKERQAREAHHQQILTTLTTIEVGAIMAGNTPLARINGKIVREGEMVADMFMVKEINDRSVDLEVDGKVYTVNMSEHAAGTGGPKPRPPMPPRR